MSSTLLSLSGHEHDGPAAAYLEELLAMAMERGASDVHLVPTDGAWRVQLRIAGLLTELKGNDTVPFDEVVSRLKVLAGMNIAQKRLPQDGHLRQLVGRRKLDIRVATLPCLHGEAVVLRLFDRDESPHPLDELGMPEGILNEVEALVDRPSGLLLVAGPVGSGKTTTLYALLDRLARRGKKIVTIEDPVEARLPGTLQVEVDEELGLNFARGLRACVRHDPDVLMIGEIRDGETARAAMEAAVLGHLVLATLHADSALLALERLIHMGVPRYQVASAVTAVLAQRLLRLDGRPVLPSTPPKRRGIFDLLRPDASLKEEILSDVRLLTSKGDALREAADELVRTGACNAAEARRVLGREEPPPPKVDESQVPIHALRS